MANPIDPIVPSLINTGGDIVSTLLTNKANQDLWREQTEYNKPVNQVARLRQAGLNPALMYGSSASPGMMSSPPSMSAPQMRITAMSDFQKQQQIDNMEATNENIQVQNEILRAEAVKASNEGYLSDRERQLIDDVDQGIPAWLRDKKGLGGILGPVLGNIPELGTKLLQLKLFQDRTNKMPDMSAFGR